MKKLCVFLVCAGAALAVADHLIITGSGGHGSAMTLNGRVGAFHYTAFKTIQAGHHDVLSGSLHFEESESHAGHRAVVKMGRPSSVSVSGNWCRFVGNGSLTRMVNGHEVTVHGVVTVNATDRRNTYHPHDPADIFRLTFTNGHGVTYGFDGLVHSGDLWVYRRHGH